MAIAQLSIDIEARLASFERDIARASNIAESNAKRIKSAYAEVGRTFETVGKTFAASLIGAGLTTGIKAVIDDLDKLNEASERLGASVEDLSALDFAGKMNGLEFEDMTQSLTKLSSKMQEAAAGSKEAADLFKDVGVKVTDASGKLKSSDQVLAEIADRFSQFEDGAAKTALAVDLFGKSGAKMVPILNGGAAGLKSMREEAEKLGGVIDGKLAKQAAEFNDNVDRLSVLAAAAGKSIVAELIPSLNKLAVEFLEAKKAGMGFWESLVGIGLSDPTKSAGAQVKSLTGEIEKLTVARNAAMASNKLDGGSIDTSSMEADIAKLQRRREYFKSIQRNEALEGAEGNYGNEGRGKLGAGGLQEIKRTTGVGGTKAAKPAKENAEASAEAKAYAKAMEDLARLTNDAEASQLELTKSQKTLYDLMIRPEWATMPDAWKETAVAQFELSQSAEKAADEQKRLNEMLGATESAGIEKARADMQLLADALERGTISAEQFVEAASARLNLLGDKAKEATDELDEFAKSAARNMQTSLADFLFDPFADGTKNMGDQFATMLQRMAAEAAAAQIMKNLLGSMGSTAGGGSGDWGWVGKAATWAGSFFADGGVMTSSGPVQLRKYANGGIANSPQLAMFGEGRTPEAYVPLPDGRSIPVKMAGGGGMTIHQNFYGQADDKAQTRRSAAAGARAALGAMNGARRYG